MNSNPRTVFVLGAGASREAGGPLMWDFLDIAETLARSGSLKKEDQELFDAVFSGIARLQIVQSKSILDLNNLESVFAAFEMAALLDTGMGRAGDIDLTHAMRRLIVATLEHRLQCTRSEHTFRPHDSFVRYAETLERLRSDARVPISIVTFNYDIGVEQALAYLGIPYDYCLSGATDNQCLRILKLHGSVNWAQCSKCGEITPWKWSDFVESYMRNRLLRSKEGDRVFLPLASSISTVQHCDAPANSDPVIVPPTWSKAEYHKKIQAVWRQAAKELAEAENIIVSGYSFPDSDHFFHHLFALGTVSEVRLKRFLVFDPDPTDSVAGRFRRLLGPTAQQRFASHKLGFSDAMQRVGDLLTIKPS